ncbi:YihY/virulence factor BrkB family protein [Ramlibacter alkalitolerans]|uniref:YihY/virulence factor BrkB family protein n=1 Tax=Ramlibacter alkalitolerans TaxID=2039631 RepID=UPI001F216D48|nr:YihY/virulence factor BrkB family protein [Ramlibacter alkalitolerans]
MIKFQPARLFRLFLKAAKAWSDDYAPSMGAAISYYTVFSLAPLLVIVIAVAGAVFGREAVQGQIVAQLSGLIGEQGASFVQSLVAASSDKDKGLIAGIISTGVLLVGATTVFAELQSALDRIWHVPPSQKPKGIWATLRARLLSFGLILGMVFLLMVSLAVSAAVAAFGAFTSGLMPGAETLLQVLNFVVSLGIATVLFAMIFKLMPSTKIDWRDVWVGAFTTAVLFEAGKFLIGLYLGKSSMTESFAAAGSLVILIAWVYYAAQIFLLGAEFTKVYAQEHGSHSGQVAMEATQATAATGEPTDSASIAGAAAAAAAKQSTPPDTVPVPRPSGAVRLDENRAVLRDEDVRHDVLAPRAWWDKPGVEAAMAGGAAVAGGVVVALLRRVLNQRRHRAA